LFAIKIFVAIAFTAVAVLPGTDPPTSPPALTPSSRLFYPPDFQDGAAAYIF